MIVVTGATGHIGNVLVRELVTRGEEVRVLIPPAEDTAPLDGLPVEIVKGDVRRLDSLVHAFRGSDIVYHLAATITILSRKSRLLHEVNVMGTRNVVEACLKSSVRRLVYTSSIHAIAEPPHGTVIDETFPFDPKRTMGEYARSKAQSTLEVIEGVKRGLDAVIICPTGVIGPYDCRPSEMGQLMIDFAKRRLKAYIDGAYDFVDVRDVVNGHILASEKGHTGENYILSGEQITVHGLLTVLEELTGVKAPTFKVPASLARIIAPLTPIYYSLTRTQPLFTSYAVYVLASNSLTSHDKASRELGYSHRSSKESIVDAINWFKENGRF